MAAILSDRIRARLEVVEEHVRRENARDLAGIMATFGEQAWYDDEPWGEHHDGANGGSYVQACPTHGSASGVPVMRTLHIR